MTAILRRFGPRLSVWMAIILLFPVLSYAKNEGQNQSLENISHFFILELDAGEARDKRSRGSEFSGWIGGEKNRVWLRNEIKEYGNYDRRFEAQAFYSRNFVKFWDAQFGITHDFDADFTKKNVNYLTAGVQGFKNHFFETEGHVFLSDKGNYSVRLRQKIDFPFLQKFVVQPYFEIDAFAQEVRDLKVKSGISDVELGVLTRYEYTKIMAPYIAFRYNVKTFGTANLAQELGERTDNFVVAVGIRLVF